MTYGMKMKQKSGARGSGSEHMILTIKRMTRLEEYAERDKPIEAKPYDEFNEVSNQREHGRDSTKYKRPIISKSKGKDKGNLRRIMPLWFNFKVEYGGEKLLVYAKFPLPSSGCLHQWFKSPHNFIKRCSNVYLSTEYAIKN